MTMPLHNKKRLGLLDLLPSDWVNRIEEKTPGIHSTVLPDEATIISGNDKECIETLKKYDLYSEDVKRHFQGLPPRTQVIGIR